jgi:hypothetical protein
MTVRYSLKGAMNNPLLGGQPIQTMTLPSIIKDANKTALFAACGTR